MLDDLDLDDLDLFAGIDLSADDAQDLETNYQPAPRRHVREARNRLKRAHKRDALRDVLDAPPGRGDSIHLVGAGKWDGWTFIPCCLDWIGGRADALYFATWTINRPNATELFELWDAGKIGCAHFLTGTYFKRRESAVYAMLLAGTRQRGGRYRAFETHAKVTLLANAERGYWLTIEGSANLTYNPRWEQAVITNDRDLYEFHREWMEEVFAATPDEPAL